MSRVASFWVVWLVVGLAGAKSWFSGACPPGACNGILVAMQLPGLLLAGAVWLGIGFAVSLLLPAKPSPYFPKALPTDNGDAALAAADESEPPDDVGLMEKYGVRLEGRQYVLRDYRYDRLVDAVNYAKLLGARGDA